MQLFSIFLKYLFITFTVACSRTIFICTRRNGFYRIQVLPMMLRNKVLLGVASLFAVCACLLLIGISPGLVGAGAIPFLDPHSLPFLDPHSLPFLDPHSLPFLDPHSISL
jgi:hypothetical protein